MIHTYSSTTGPSRQAKVNQDRPTLWMKENVLWVDVSVSKTRRSDVVQLIGVLIGLLIGLLGVVGEQ